jgi:hypothetical protein
MDGRPLATPATVNGRTYIQGALPASDEGVARATYDEANDELARSARVPDSVMLREHGRAGYQDSAVPE